MNAYTPTLKTMIELRNESYYFLTDTPQRLGDKAWIEVKNVGTRYVMLCETQGVVRCNQWLVEI